MFKHENIIKQYTNLTLQLALLINDDLLAETILVHMQKKEFQVNVHYNIKSFEKNLQENRNYPDILIFDMDFFDFKILKKLQDNPYQKNMKIIAISGHSDMSVRLKAVRAQVYSFFSKPLDIEGLANQLNGSLALKKQRIYGVLIIDDSVADSRLYQRILEPAGVRVRFVNEPLNTLTELEYHKPDVVIIDYHMPKVNGLDILKVIRQIYTASELPVLFITGSQKPQILSRIRKETNLEPISKTLGHEDFVERVFSVIQ